MALFAEECPEGGGEPGSVGGGAIFLGESGGLFPEQSVGICQVLEGCRHNGVDNLVHAPSSSL